MKKYWYIFKATLMENLQYIMNIMMGFISFFMILLVLFNLWQYMYSNTANLINGYSYHQMLWYVTITEVIWFGSRNRTIITQISNDIKSGSIAYGMNKPYHYILYMISRHLGEIAIKFILFLGAGIIIGCIVVGPIPGFHLLNLLPLAITFFLGIMINAFLQMTISVLSFWIEDAMPFHWIYDKMILVLGLFFPVEMFPSWAQPVIKASPIYVINYGPAKLVTDFQQEVFLRVLLTQGIYFILSLIILLGFYQRGVKKVNVNGG